MRASPKPRYDVGDVFTKRTENSEYEFVAFRGSYRSPKEATMEAAKEQFNTYLVINKLEGES